MKSFSVGFQTRDTVEVLSLVGELDAHTVSELDAALERCFRDGRHRIVVNGAGLKYISSAGLGVFLGHIDEARDSGGDIKISNLSARVYDVFDLLGFPVLFNIVETEDEAVALFGDLTQKTLATDVASPSG